MFSLESWALLGDAVGGFATFAGLVFAFVEVSRRRAEARREKRSAAATQALTSLTRTIDALTNWHRAFVEVLDYEAPSPEHLDDSKQLGQSLRASEARATRALDELHDATTAAFVHLDAHETAPLLAVHDLAHEMLDQVSDAVSLYDSDEIAADKDLRNRLTEGLALCRAELAQGAQLLTPIARLQR